MNAALGAVIAVLAALGAWGWIRAAGKPKDAPQVQTAIAVGPPIPSDLAGLQRADVGLSEVEHLLDDRKAAIEQAAASPDPADLDRKINEAFGHHP